MPDSGAPGGSSVAAPHLLVLVNGETRGERNHRKGSAFEIFVAQLLAKDGFERPTTERLRVIKHAIELDIATNHITTGRRLIAECKAYKKSVPARELLAFRGKLELDRYDSPGADGLFVALPALTGHGLAALEVFQAHDPYFTYWSMDHIVEILDRHDLIHSTEPPAPYIYRSPVIVLTEFGLCAAAKLTDPESREALAINAWAASGFVPQPILELLTSSEYADTLEVRGLPDPSIYDQFEGYVDTLQGDTLAIRTLDETGEPLTANFSRRLIQGMNLQETDRVKVETVLIGGERITRIRPLPPTPENPTPAQPADQDVQ